MTYQWTPDLNTGNVVIDTEHKQLIGAVNQLLDACSAGKGRDQLSASLRFLQNYTRQHFSHEEELQRTAHYPDFVNHKRYHEGFCKVVDNLVAEFQQQGPTIALVAKVNAQVGGWLINHIKVEDKKVAAHLKNSK